MIQFKTIDGLLLRDMVVAGAALLEKNREAVDALNVFPVPDGDTGTNMSMTFTNGYNEAMKCTSDSLSDVAKAFSREIGRASCRERV